MTAIWQAFENRIDLRHALETSSKQSFDAMFDEMIEGLNMALNESPAPAKSSADCDTACDLAKNGRKEICQADRVDIRRQRS